MEKYSIEMEPGGDYIASFQRDGVLFVCFQTALYIIDGDNTAEVICGFLTGVPLFDGNYVYLGANYVGLMKWNWRKKKLVWKVGVEGKSFPEECRIINSWWLAGESLHLIVDSKEIIVNSADGSLAGRRRLRARNPIARTHYFDSSRGWFRIELFSEGRLSMSPSRGGKSQRMNLSCEGKRLGRLVYLKVVSGDYLCVASAFPRVRYWVDLCEWRLVEFPLFGVPSAFSWLCPGFAVITKSVNCRALSSECPFLAKDDGSHLYLIGANGEALRVFMLGKPVVDIVCRGEEAFRVLLRDSAEEYSLRTIEIDAEEWVQKNYQK